MKKQCRISQEEFSLTEADLALLERLSPVFNGKTFPLPPPTLSPAARLQRRLCWRPELHLFKRECSFSGKRMLSYFPPEPKALVYHKDIWLSDEWDPLAYGREYDFSKPFFEQFSKLLLAVPQPNIATVSNENSDYTNNTANCRDCYLVAGAARNEKCYYGTFINDSNYCIDNCFIHNCELCHECVDCKNCYNLKHSWNCIDCRDSYFLHNCRHCSDCLGSVNLIQKKFVFFNEQLSEAAYREKLAALKLDSRSGILETAKRFSEHRLHSPYPFFLGEMNENVSGNNINNSRRSHYCFDVTSLEDCAYCCWFHQSKDCMDCYSWGSPAELCYECLSIGTHAYKNLFCSNCYSCSDMLYCLQCRNCSNCFGCVSLRNKEYCFFNKQFSPSDYLALLERTISQMQEQKLWGEFFPMSTCPLNYNQTVAQDYFPLTQAKAKALGAHWSSTEPPLEKHAEILTAPDSILDLDESLKDIVLLCKHSERPFRVSAQELKIYRQQFTPLPELAFEARHQARITNRLPWRLWLRSCTRCDKDIQTAFSPARREQIYCEDCYQEEVFS